ncbi:MAG: LPS export ABC transporter periplasmic protein LptC [bacterium]
MSRQQIGLTVFLVLLIAVSIWVIFTPKEEFRNFLRRQIAEQQKEPDLEFKRVILSEISRGIRYWEIEAATSKINNDSGTADMDTITGKFYQDNEPVFRIKAPRALWKMKDKEIMIDKVEGSNTDAQGVRENYSFKADTMKWNMTNKKIELSGNPKIEVF